MEFKFEITEHPKKKLMVTLYSSPQAAFSPEYHPDAIWRSTVDLTNIKLDHEELLKFLKKYLNPVLSNLFYLTLKDHEMG
jgi:hypothetical protein